MAGQFAFGYISDKRVSVSTLAVISSVFAAGATLALWGPAKSLGLLLAFSPVYGFFRYGFGSMRVVMGRVVGADALAAVVIYCLLVFLQGIGNVLVGLSSAALLKKRVSAGDYGAARYGSLRCSLELLCFFLR